MCSQYVARCWGVIGLIAPQLASAIDVKLTIDEAQKALEAGRGPMEKANSSEDVNKVLQQASLATRVGSDPGKIRADRARFYAPSSFAWRHSDGRRRRNRRNRRKRSVCLTSSSRK
jgi:hypothetical protein